MYPELKDTSGIEVNLESRHGLPPALWCVGGRNACFLHASLQLLLQLRRNNHLCVQPQSVSMQPWPEASCLQRWNPCLVK